MWGKTIGNASFSWPRGLKEMLEEALEQGNEMFRAIKLKDLFCSQDGKS